MKKYYPRVLYWGLSGLFIIGIGIALRGSSRLHAFSHSLDAHADSHRIEEKYKAEAHRIAEERKRAQAEKARIEQNKKLEEMYKRHREEQIRREEEERKERKKEHIKIQNEIAKILKKG